MYDNDNDLLKNKIFDIILRSLRDQNQFMSERCNKIFILHVEYNEIFNVFDKLDVIFCNLINQMIMIIY